MKKQIKIADVAIANPMGMTAFCVLVIACATMLLSSCATTGSNGGSADSQSASAANAIYDINVLLYAPPVEVSEWVPDGRQSDNSEGAALNIVSQMQRGNVDGWLNCWAPDQRPNLSAEDRQKLIDHWSELKNGNVLVVGRVVAGADLIEQIDVQEASGKKESLQLPLKLAENKWWLFNMDPNNEYMRWQTAPHKKVDQLNPKPLQQYVNDLKPRQ